MKRAKKTLTEAFRTILRERRRRYRSWTVFAEDLGVTNKIPEGWATEKSPNLQTLDRIIERDETILDDLLCELEPDTGSPSPRWHRLAERLHDLTRGNYDEAREIVGHLEDIADLSSLPLLLESLSQEVRRADFIAGKAIQAQRDQPADQPAAKERGENS